MSEATQPQSMEDTIAAKLSEIQARVDQELDAEPAALAAPVAELDEGDPATEVLDPEHAVAEETPEQPLARKAPSAWRKQAAEKFAALDPLLQDEIDRREADFHKGIEGYKSKAAFADELNQTLTPYLPMLQAFNQPVSAVINNMLATESVARYGSPQQKIELAHRMLAEYGIDPQALVNYQYQQPQIDPQLQAVQTQVQQLQQHLSQQEFQRQQHEQASLHSEISAFAADASHPHFEAVKAHMSALLLNGQANNLQEAYDQAVWANPQTRQAMLTEQQQAQSAERARQAKAAKAAAAVNVRKTGTLPAQTTATATSIEDTLRAQMATMRSEGRF